MNRVILIGRLTRDVEIRRTTSGISYVMFTLAVNRRVAPGQEPQADFISCVAWRRTAELMNQYLHKGSQIAVDGRIETRSYEREGNRVYVTNVVADRVQFLGSRSPSMTSDDFSVSEFPTDNNLESSSTVDFDEAFSMDAFDASDEDLPF